MFFLFACKSKQNREIYSYVYCEGISIEKCNFNSIAYKSVVSSDKVLISDSFAFNIEFNYKIIDDDIFVIKDDSSFILYNFKDTTSFFRKKEIIPPFYKEVKLVGIKDYYVDGDAKTIYHFVENGFDGSLHSYFLKGEGFICFYEYNENRYIYLNSPRALEISSQFLNDTNFFAFLKLKETDKMIKRKYLL